MAISIADARFQGIVVLAHWASDVLVGFVVGALIEGILRLWTGYPYSDTKESPGT
jgi:undecaprenyl-diphosphatase